MKDISIIVAMTKDRVIGIDNRLAWHIPEDLKLFKKITMDNVVLMGRNTYLSIYDILGRPLPGRENVVVSAIQDTENQPAETAKKFDHKHVSVISSLDEAIARSRILDKPIFIIGGESVYNQTLPIADKLYLSLVKEDYPGNRYFPEVNFAEWQLKYSKDLGPIIRKVYRKKR